MTEHVNLEIWLTPKSLPLFWNSWDEGIKIVNMFWRLRMKTLTGSKSNLLSSTQNLKTEILKKIFSIMGGPLELKRVTTGQFSKINKNAIKYTIGDHLSSGNFVQKVAPPPRPPMIFNRVHLWPTPSPMHC